MTNKSILLNFSTRLVIENSDPFIGLVAAQGHLLFSNQLSVGHFPSDPSEGKSREKELVVKMRGLLESRTLSNDDKDETIRLIIITDMRDGIFAGQEARSIKQTITDVFGRQNSLLKRFRYLFVFIDDITKSGSSIFRLAAYNGMGASGWITSEMLKFNELKNDFLSGSPNDEDKLEDVLKPHPDSFAQAFRNRMAVVKALLDKVMCGEAFSKHIEQILLGVHTVAELRETDFDECIDTAIGDLIGLCAKDFRKDSVFFIVNVKTSPISVWKICDIYIKSLIQLLASMDDEDFEKKIAQFAESNPATIFTSPLPSAEIINYKKIGSLRQMIASVIPLLNDLNRKESSEVEYKTFELKEECPNAEYDKEYMEKRESCIQKMEDELKPHFFFGMRDNDWEWYNTVTTLMEEMRILEQNNLCPHIVEPRRINATNIHIGKKTSTYAELHDEIEKEREELRNETTGATSELNKIWPQRQKKLDRVLVLEAEARTAMKHLGVVRRFAIFALIIILLITVCFGINYLNHSPFNGKQILFALGGACLLTGISTITISILLQRKVKSTFYSILAEYDGMLCDLNDYLAAYNRRIRSRNRVEVIQKQIDEMQSKYNDFDGHKKRVELWRNHYSAMKEMLLSLSDQPSPQDNDDGMTPKEYSINPNLLKTEFPSFPMGFVQSYSNGPVKINESIVLENTTSFVNNFRMTKKE